MIPEDTRTGEFYVARRDGLIDLTYTSAVAYYVGPSGVPVLLERPHGIKSRAELERHQAEREERRNAPKQRRPWTEQKPAMRYEAAIRFAPATTVERLNDPKWSKPGRLM